MTSHAEVSPLHPHEPSIPPTLDSEGRCLICAMQVRAEKMHGRLLDTQAELERLTGELEAVVAAVKAVIENCKTAAPEMIRHQLVGLLPEVQEMEPEVKARMREKGLGDLVDRHEAMVRENWAKYGYGEAR
jgi:hypothetical protein